MCSSLFDYICLLLVENILFCKEEEEARKRSTIQGPKVCLVMNFFL